MGASCHLLPKLGEFSSKVLLATTPLGNCSGTRSRVALELVDGRALPADVLLGRGTHASQSTVAFVQLQERARQLNANGGQVHLEARARACGRWQRRRLRPDGGRRRDLGGP